METSASNALGIAETVRVESTSRIFHAMGNTATIGMWAPELSCEERATVLDAAEQRISELEKRWSRFLSNSDVSRMNSSIDSGHWLPIHNDTVNLIERANAGWVMTNGVFDPTIVEALCASGYTESRDGQPGASRLNLIPKQQKAKGMKNIELNTERTGVKLHGVGFDAGGIGKGLAADIVTIQMLEQGAGGVYVAIGGDVRTGGEVPNEWVIGIEAPWSSQQLLYQVQVENSGVCTSTKQAKTWKHNGRMTHHLINPKTGKAMRGDIVSATVLSSEAWTSEIYCKAVMPLQPIDAIMYLEARKLEGVLIDKHDLAWSTRNFHRFTV